MNFSELGLHPALAKQCESLGYSEPTPIQGRAVPVILGGADLIGCAETGTGKTAAFLLPLIQKIASSKGVGVRALILSPTRELASQIESNLRALDPKNRTRSVMLIGGTGFGRQLDGLRQGVPIVIATPGRLLDHIERGSIDLSRVGTLVLDEADRMLDMGFWPAIRRVIEKLPAKRQTLLFSATMSPAIEGMARATLCKPELIEVSRRGKAAVTVSQTAYPVATESKTSLLLHLLEREQLHRVLVFTRTRRGAERLAHTLAARKHQVDCIHADRSQSQREAALRGFKEGRYRVLVATDVAARGIDVDAVSHVINYDVPDSPEDYVHRIGRTGRRGLSGQAMTLVTPADEMTVHAIERLMGQSIERTLLPDFGGTDMTIKVSSRSATSFKRSSAGTRSFGPRRARR